MKKFTLVFALTLLCCSLAISQEELTVDDLLRYFPEGQYLSMQHIDMTRLEKADSYLQYRKLTGGSREKLGQFYAIPESLAKNWTSYTAMIITHLGTDDASERVVEKDKLNPGADVHLSIDSGYRLAVLRFPLDFPLKAKIARNDEFQQTEEKLDNQIILTYQNNRLGGHFSSSFYAFAASSNELLICNDIKILKAMVSTGKGETMPVDIESFFTGAFEIIPRLGPHWRMQNPYHQTIKIIAEIEKNEPDNEKAERFKEAVSRAMPTITDYLLTDPLQIRQMTIFHSSKAARDYLAKWKKNLSRLAAGEDYQRVIAKSSILSTEGNVFISSKVWNKEHLDAEKKQKDVMKKKFMEEYEKRQKEKMKNTGKTK